MDDSQAIKDLEEKLLSTNVDIEVLKGTLDELKETVFSMKSNISELKAEKLEIPQPEEPDYNTIATTVIESEMFQEALEKAVASAVHKHMLQQAILNSPAKPRHINSQDMTPSNSTAMKKHKKRVKSETDYLITPMILNSDGKACEFRDFTEEMKKLSDRVEFLERIRGKAKTGLIRRNSFDDLNEENASAPSLKDDIQKIWTALNSMIDNFQDQINAIKAELSNTKASVFDTLYSNLNDSSGMISSTRGSNVSTFHSAELDQEIESVVESKFKIFQTALGKAIDSQIETIRTEIMNNRIKSEQRLETVQVSILKQISAIEDRLDAKDEEPKEKEEDEGIAFCIRKINEKLKLYDTNFANINKNLSNFNVALQKQESLLSSSTLASQESVNSIWATIGIMNQRIDHVEESRGKAK